MIGNQFPGPAPATRYQCRKGNILKRSIRYDDDSLHPLELKRAKQQPRDRSRVAAIAFVCLADPREILTILLNPGLPCDDSGAKTSDESLYLVFARQVVEEDLLPIHRPQITLLVADSVLKQNRIVVVDLRLNLSQAERRSRARQQQRVGFWRGNVS